MTNERLPGLPTPQDPTVAMPPSVPPPVSGAPVSGAPVSGPAQPISGGAAQPVSGTAAAQPVSGAQPGPYPGTQPGYPPAAGYPQRPGYPQPGYAQPVYAQPVYAQPGYAPPGHPQGYPPPGYPPAGYPRPVQFAALNAPDGRRLAEFGDRLLARLIDAAIMAGIGFALFIPLMIAIIALVGGASQTGSSGSGAIFAIGVVVIEVLLIAAIFAAQYYYEVEWVLRHEGQTVGKRIMKIAIVPLTPGAPMDRGVYAKRWLVQLGMSFIPFMSYVDGLWQLWDKPYKQCLHDKWPQTVVVKVGA